MKFLQQKGAIVRGFDPIAMPNSKLEVPDVEYASDMWKAVEGADAIVIATEWNEFRTMNLKRL